MLAGLPGMWFVGPLQGPVAVFVALRPPAWGADACGSAAAGSVATATASAIAAQPNRLDESVT